MKLDIYLIILLITMAYFNTLPFFEMNNVAATYTIVSKYGKIK